MPKPHISESELAHLKLAREEADRAYNDALTALDHALPSQLNRPSSEAREGDTNISTLEANWRLFRDEGPTLGTGWRARLNGLVWKLIGPALQQQQEFNSLVVNHIKKNEAATDDAVKAITAHINSLVAFQSKLIQYLQQVTPYVDTKNYEAAGLGLTWFGALDGVADEMRKRAESSAAREQRLIEHVDELRTSVGKVQHGLLAVHTAIEQLSPESNGNSSTQVNAIETLNKTTDAYTYVGFENMFRGAQEEIRARMSNYLHLFEGASDVLDVGCGRGEFLDLLREAGVTARGLDINSEMIEACHARGLTAEVGDALSYLEQQKDRSLGGLFAAQVVEHLQPDYLVRLLGIAGRKLRPGSTIVLETVNPACWFAFFDAYIRDITHVRPLHPDTLKYLLTASGFQKTSIRYSAPYPEDAKLQHIAVPGTDSDSKSDPALAESISTLNTNVDKLNRLIFTHLDYAAIGQLL